MAQPYWTVPIIQDYLREITALNYPYQERVDHLWLNILSNYFPQSEDFGVERESFVAVRTRHMVNVAVTRMHANGRMHKVVIVEAKRFPRDRAAGWENNYDWATVEETLRQYMIRARRRFGIVQAIHGILAVGDLVEFYTLDSWNSPGSFLAPYPDQVDPGTSRTLSVHADQHAIHDILSSIALEIATDSNIY